MKGVREAPSKALVGDLAADSGDSPAGAFSIRQALSTLGEAARNCMDDSLCYWWSWEAWLCILKGLKHSDRKLSWAVCIRMGVPAMLLLAVLYPLTIMKSMMIVWLVQACWWGPWLPLWRSAGWAAAM